VNDEHGNPKAGRSWLRRIVRLLVSAEGIIIMAILLSVLAVVLTLMDERLLAERCRENTSSQQTSPPSEKQ
jgi:lipopolysaccharide/colanic/teichoic acid biosynthesis glycosyltransferase